MNIRFGECVLDRGRRELVRRGESVALTGKAFELLELLLETRPNAVAKAAIYDRLWPATFVSEVNLSRLVFEIRRAIGDDARRPVWIRTVRGFGYAFSGAATSLAPRAVSSLRAAEQCRLILRDREVALAEGENVLGRSHAAAVWLEGTSVSRRHARILVEGRQATLEDLDSKNGTFWRGQPISAPTLLADGDEIRVGRVKMTFRVVPSEGSTATGGSDHWR